jgi:hypothetical protein
MTFILVPVHADPNGDLQINAWNWRSTLELLHRARLLDDEAVERAAAQGAGGQVAAEQALWIAEFLDRYLTDLTPGQRVRADGTVTSEPRTYRLDQEPGSCTPRPTSGCRSSATSAGRAAASR